MKITLLHPPLDDPTLPYHSTAYLRGHLAQNGFADVTTRDLNIEFLNYCFEERVCESLYATADQQLRALGAKSSLTFDEQEQYYALWSAAAARPESVQRAVAALRDKQTFLDHETYQASVKAVEGFCATLSALSYPAEIIGFRLKGHGRYSIYNLDDLFNVDLCRRICFPIERYFYDRCVTDPDLVASDCIGISVVYDYQLLMALHLARLIKQRWRDKIILLGGTSISQTYKYLRDKSLLTRFFEVCDAMVVGEGETAICEIADSDGDLVGNSKIPNLITYDPRLDKLHLPGAIHYEHVAALGRPMYEYPWDLYVAPERAINYAPTRGCYWNRCTFCDYGLNTDKPTSPWRERPVSAVIDDLRHIRDEQGVRYVYFAVDVMAPGYLEKLSDALIDAGLDLRWSAELRMEKIFSQERCRKLARSGCVSISFGMESGNQRILDLIDKGTKIEYMGATMKNFAEAGIAVQLMSFSHFPTESAAERQDTIRFVTAHRDSWSAGGIGKFSLTGTALVAKDPARFGVTLIDTRGTDIVRTVGFQVDGAAERQVVSAEESDGSFDDTQSVFPATLGRPWAGGIDSLHSMIYYGELGRTIFKDLALTRATRQRNDRPARILDGPIVVNGKLAASDFDISAIFKARGRLRDYVADLQQSAVEPTYREFERWQQNLAALNRNQQRSYWLVQEGRCQRLADVVYELLLSAADSGRPLRQVLDGFSTPAQERLEGYFLSLAERGYIDVART